MPVAIASVPVISASALPVDHFRRDVAAIASLFYVKVFSLEALTCAVFNMLAFGTLEVALSAFTQVQRGQMTSKWVPNETKMHPGY